MSPVGLPTQSESATLPIDSRQKFTFFCRTPPPSRRAATEQRPAIHSVTDQQTCHHLQLYAHPIATMKRKLDKNDQPSSPTKSDEESSPPAPKQEKKEVKEKKQPKAEPSFAELGLDPRLVQAVAKQSFEKPTLVQRKAIPLALQGQDVLCKAKTGSGKTAAYVLPLLSGILKRKTVRGASQQFFGDCD